MVARETRISSRYLDAIENEAFHVLPGGVFNRGFIRTYATKLGLDPEAMLAQYAALTEDAQRKPAPGPNGGAPATRAERRILPIALGALVLVIILYYAFDRSFVAPAEAPRLDEAAAGTVTPDPAPASPAPAEPAATVPDIVDSDVGTGPESDDNVRILLEVHAPTWIALDSDGEQVVEGVILEPGTRRTFGASEVIVLRVGNAAGLTLTINGEQAPGLGTDNQVRNLRITPDGFLFF